MSVIQPLRDRVLVRRSTADQVTPGGLVIPGTAQDKPCEGVVVARGTGMLLMDGTSAPMLVAPRDKVVWQKDVGTEIDVGGEKLLLVRESDILCIRK